jgi:hypothetical protein
MDDTGFLPGRMKLAFAGGRLNTSGCPGVEKSVQKNSRRHFNMGIVVRRTACILYFAEQSIKALH